MEPVDAHLRLRPEQATLTAAQVAEAERFMSERIQAQLSTAPVDETAAEDLLRQAYTAAGVAAPNHIHWLDGPLELVAALAAEDWWVSSIDDAYRERVPHCVWDDVKLDQAEIALLGRGVLDSIDHRIRQVAQQTEKRAMVRFDPRAGHGLLREIWRRIVSRTWDPLRTNVGERIWRAVADAAGWPLSPWFRDSVWSGLDFSFWHTICAYDQAYLHIEMRYLNTYLAPNEASALAQFNELVSGYWLGQAVALLVRKPLFLLFDDLGRLHSATGRCVEYPDGWGFFAWHGVPAPERVVLAPETLTRDDFLGERNVEARRIIQERMGAERFVWELAATYIDSGPQGVLYEVELPDDPERVARYVQVLDPSTGREYFLRVPPSVQTATEAVAWTFGRTPEEYHPAQES
jgi:hypothetical protein